MFRLLGSNTLIYNIGKANCTRHFSSSQTVAYLCLYGFLLQCQHPSIKIMYLFQPPAIHNYISTFYTSIINASHFTLCHTFIFILLHILPNSVTSLCISSLQQEWHNLQTITALLSVFSNPHKAFCSLFPNSNFHLPYHSIHEDTNT